MQIKEFLEKLNHEQLSLLYGILKKCRCEDNDACFGSGMNSFKSDFLDLDLNARSELFSESDPQYFTYTKARGNITLLHCLCEFIYEYSNFKEGVFHNTTLCEISLQLLACGADSLIPSSTGVHALPCLIYAYPAAKGLEYWINPKYIDLFAAMIPDGKTLQLPLKGLKHTNTLVEENLTVLDFVLSKTFGNGSISFRIVSTEKTLSTLLAQPKTSFASDVIQDFCTKSEGEAKTFKLESILITTVLHKILSTFQLEEPPIPPIKKPDPSLSPALIEPLLFSVSDKKENVEIVQILSDTFIKLFTHQQDENTMRRIRQHFREVYEEMQPAQPLETKALRKRGYCTIL